MKSEQTQARTSRPAAANDVGAWNAEDLSSFQLFWRQWNKTTFRLHTVRVHRGLERVGKVYLWQNPEELWKQFIRRGRVDRIQTESKFKYASVVSVLEYTVSWWFAWSNSWRSSIFRRNQIGRFRKNWTQLWRQRKNEENRQWDFLVWTSLLRFGKLQIVISEIQH